MRCCLTYDYVIGDSIRGERFGYDLYGLRSLDFSASAFGSLTQEYLASSMPSFGSPYRISLLNLTVKTYTITVLEGAQYSARVQRGEEREKRKQKQRRKKNFVRPT